ncbi:hypothetical protein [Micromonospora deserti]|uniref:Uncharacterized protein n=1 Tax=Micromonospora deserti TaxID=2070366 RepID=A0A2W2C5I9_9ACTN|nr:hypothetical protein [Micromonospora deserti]PZF94631.1 hypothetical protein C1I99_19135 [Micromonospora deserti]
MVTEFFTHPALGLVATDDLSTPLPLVESDLPDWWNELDEERQEAAFDAWWRSLAKWLSTRGADQFSVDVLEPSDRRSLESADGVTTLGRGRHTGTWTPRAADVLGSTVSPQRMEINGGGRLLLQLTGNWEGVCIRCSDEEAEQLHALFAEAPVRPS